MPTFAYSGRTRAGQTVTGERVADTMDAAVAGLRREQIMVTRIDPAKAAKVAKAAKPAGPKGGKSVPAKNLAIFTRQFSVMIDAGLPLVQCLEILGKQEPHKNFAAVILKVREDVESGAALADAMKKHPKTFDALFSNMIAAGEAGGILDTILKRLAVYIEKNVKLKGEVKSAMIYPVAVIVIAGVVVAAILWKVIPDLCVALCRPWRSAAASDPSGHRRERHARQLRLDPDHRPRPDRVCGSNSYYGTNNGRHMIDAIAAEDCRSSATFCGRSRSPGSAARSRRCSPRACRSWTASTSPRRPPATPLSKMRCRRRDPASSAARRYPRPFAKRTCFLRWSFR